MEFQGGRGTAPVVVVRAGLLTPAWCAVTRPYTQSVLSTYIVESRVSIVGVVIMIWVSIPHIGT